jgi:polygalacturonase
MGAHRGHTRPPKNTDGVDIDSLSNVTVAHSSIEDGDDGIVVKTNSGPAANITVRNNHLYGTMASPSEARPCRA